MRDPGAVVGVALAESLLLVVASGFVVESTREMYLVIGAFAGGLVSAWLMDQVRALRRKRQRAGGRGTKGGG